MTSADILALLPYILIATTVIIAMLMVAIRRCYPLTAGLTLLGLLGALVVTIIPLDRATEVTSLLVVDAYARCYIGLILVTGIVIAIFSYRYVTRHSAVSDEYYLVLLIAILGCMVLVSSSHFASVFLGLELLSVSLYVLIAYPRSEAQRLEAGIKYLIPAAISASFLLFGMALVYAASGTMTFGQISSASSATENSSRLLFLTGLGLMTVGFGFKLGLAPFHLWVADVYQGAPTPVSAFIATASKGAIFAVMMRLFTTIGLESWRSVFWTFSLIAVTTMFVGNLLALRQDNLKRLLGYSSIAHMGYVLVAFLATGTWGTAAMIFYFLAYFTTVLCAFGVLIVLSGRTDDFQDLQACHGLAFRRPYLAAILTFALLSLAGIPLTAGFLGKFYVLGAGIREDRLWLVIAMVLNSAISLFYYLRVVLTLFAEPSEHTSNVTAPSMPAVRVMLGGLTFLLFWIGIYPAIFLGLVESVASSLP